MAQALAPDVGQATDEAKAPGRDPEQAAAVATDLEPGGESVVAAAPEQAPAEAGAAGASGAGEGQAEPQAGAPWGQAADSAPDGVLVAEAPCEGPARQGPGQPRQALGHRMGSLHSMAHRRS